ncbi:MAG: hypothetical protein ACE5G8_02330 [Anaerolineae bacterium]
MAERVQVLDWQFNHFPARFRFDRGGAEVRVDAVERCWTEWVGRRRAVRYHFRVRCGAARYHLREDSASGRWLAAPA